MKLCFIICASCVVIDLATEQNKIKPLTDTVFMKNIWMFLAVCLLIFPQIIYNSKVRIKSKICFREITQNLRQMCVILSEFFLCNLEFGEFFSKN